MGLAVAAFYVRFSAKIGTSDQTENIADPATPIDQSRTMTFERNGGKNPESSTPSVEVVRSEGAPS